MSQMLFLANLLLAGFKKHCYAACSDVSTGKHNKNDDLADISISDLAYPATTDAKKLAHHISTYHHPDKMTVVFSTYQSLEVISKAQHEHGLPAFDLVICDEAHRTTGATLSGDDESSFVKIHDEAYIKSALRLYMTTTPRVFGDKVQKKAKEVDAVLCSMDDTINFSDAVAKGLLCDYKVLVLPVDDAYLPTIELLGDIKRNLELLVQTAHQHNAWQQTPKRDLSPYRRLRQSLIEEMNSHANSSAFPLKPQKIIWVLRTAIDIEDIAICDVGAHKMWMARMFRCEVPNTCIISNGMASMGIALPGVIAAKLACPNKAAVAVTGDAGFLMNVQELETAVRLGLSLVVLIWNDSGYGLIRWKQQRDFGRTSYVEFNNPDFVKLAESFGAVGVRVTSADELLPVLNSALAHQGVTVIDCPVDYSENSQLVARLGNVVE